MTSERQVVVIPTRTFERQVKRIRVTRNELSRIISELERAPDQGDLIPGSGGARKVRFAGRGRGKSGGYRVVTALVSFRSADSLYLLAIYAKSDKVNLSQGEVNRLRKTLLELKSDRP